MAEILNHGKYWNNETKKIEKVFVVICPECQRCFAIYSSSIKEKLPVICDECCCEFIPEESDIC